MATGLNTGLNPICGIKTLKDGSENLEGFLTAVGKTSSKRLSDADASNARTIKPEKSTKYFRN